MRSSYFQGSEWHEIDQSTRISAALARLANAAGHA
jgi:hypothetical protein